MVIFTVLRTTWTEFMRSIAEEEIWSMVKVWNGGRWDRFLSTVKTKYGRIC
ncbi:hypothetical protein SISSUDRAFT_1068168 [Sistotremastrum suecicum HHB10207 ss-3]|uniref:Uncharacterized protein n=1 Tax=Sistotremastrum suecicum HHB10207 ss-3 TaxID=1314776 RepID=A0A165WED9_9AGAM|nr:hypothetical protein SISSUDRAFT_1068168 [Sistotremastrum suecicum HHB10207 ss-3]